MEELLPQAWEKRLFPTPGSLMAACIRGAVAVAPAQAGMTELRRY